MSVSLTMLKDMVVSKDMKEIVLLSSKEFSSPFRFLLLKHMLHVLHNVAYTLNIANNRIIGYFETVLITTKSRMRSYRLC